MTKFSPCLITMRRITSPISSFQKFKFLTRLVPKVYLLQNTLVCMEMLILSLAGGIAFSYKDFIEGGRKSGSILSVLKGNWNSFFQDFRLIKPKKRGFTSVSQTEDLEKRLSERHLKEFESTVNLKELKTSLARDYV